MKGDGDLPQVARPARAGPLREPLVVLIVAADPHALALMREAVRLAYPGVTLQLARDTDQTQHLIATFLPDWLLLDLNLLSRLRATLVPEGARRSKVTVVAISGHNQDDRLLSALRLGVAGFVIKHDPAEQIARDLRQIQSGTPALSQALAGQILRELDLNCLAAELTDSQLELLTWIYAGDTPAEAAGRMRLKPAAVAESLAEIWRKTVFPNPLRSITGSA